MDAKAWPRMLFSTVGPLPWVWVEVCAVAGERGCVRMGAGVCVWEAVGVYVIVCVYVYVCMSVSVCSACLGFVLT